jgi:hypothetical protein
MLPEKALYDNSWQLSDIEEITGLKRHVRLYEICRSFLPKGRGTISANARAKRSSVWLDRPQTAESFHVRLIVSRPLATTGR